MKGLRVTLEFFPALLIVSLTGIGSGRLELFHCYLLSLGLKGPHSRRRLERLEFVLQRLLCPPSRRRTTDCRSQREGEGKPGRLCKRRGGGEH